MNPSDQPSTSSAGPSQPSAQPPAHDIIDGNCISAQVSDKDSECDIVPACSANPDSVDGGDTIPSELVVKTSLECYAGEGIYKISAGNRGICLIINNIKFEDQEFNREGSEKDGDSLQKVFTQLGYVVHYLQDLTSREMIQTFQDYSKRADHWTADCFVGIILTHGWKQNTLFGTDHALVSLDEDLISQFNNGNCPQLIGKPKLFFVQACRGDIHDMGVCLQNVADAAGFAAVAEKQIQQMKLPSWSDTVICFSTIDGYVSLRNVNTGSWFGDALIRCLCEHACDTELHSLFKKVNEKLMLREGTSMLKQSLEIVYRGWSRDFYFNPGHYTF